MPSKVLVAKMLVADMRHGTCVKAVDVSCAKPSNATATKATDVTATKAASAKATHVTSAKAAHVASTAHAAAHAAAVAAATTTTAAASGLCSRGEQASGQHYACQGHYHSPFHDILHSNSADFSASGSHQGLAC
jgi:hypothetical protein